MAPGLAALRDNRVNPPLREQPRFGDRIALERIKIPADLRARTISASGKPK